MTLRHACVLLVGWMALVLTGCPPTIPPLPSLPDAGSDLGIDINLQLDAPTDISPPMDTGIVCGGGQLACGGRCTDPMTDTQNCGACGHACPMTQTCTGGVCLPCTGGSLTMCAFTCVDLLTDPLHCGDCNIPCSFGEVCQSGECVCAPGQRGIFRGTFMMGAVDLDDTYGNTAPHTVTVDGFCIDITEVTVSAYDACVAAGVCGPPETALEGCNWTLTGPPPSGGNNPVNCVSWTQARAYCQWVNGGGGDLPTEAQWEYAAGGMNEDGGVTDLEYPWGLAAPSDQLCWSGGSSGSLHGTCPVMSFPAPALGPAYLPDTSGLFDMAGNVWEWTRDCYVPYGQGTVTNPDIEPPAGCALRTNRGGSWSDEPGETDAAKFRAAFRGSNDPSTQSGYLGFRCARGH